MRAPLSAVFITKDAANVLAPALESVEFADEILIVDSGSTDRTVAIAREHGARVIQHPWLGFGPQKQFAVSAAKHAWVLCLDSDERVSVDLRVSIEREIAQPRARVYAMPRCNRFMGRWLRHGEGYPDWSVRFFHRDFARWSDDPVHERVISETPVARLQGDLLHESAETLATYLAKQRRYTSLQADELVKASFAGNLVRMLASPIVRFVRFYVFKAGFLDGLPGLAHIAIGAWTSAAKYGKAVWRRVGVGAHREG